MNNPSPLIPQGSLLEQKSRSRARVKVAFTLSDERVASLQQTLVFERPVPAGSQETEPDAVAQAMGEALRDAVHDVTNRVVTDLASASSGACPVAARP